MVDAQAALRKSPRLKAKKSPGATAAEPSKKKDEPSKKKAARAAEAPTEGAPKSKKRKVEAGAASKGAGAVAVKADASGNVNVADVKDISKSTREVLKERGITSLFEIQTQAFAPAFSGKDVVGRAKTGCGKTLAFVLPCVERFRSLGLASRKKRTPLSVAVAPTRELARQIFNDFDAVGTAAGFVVRCLYGGTAFGPQCDDLRSGVDMLVCTPGRLLDHIRRETINLSACQVLILDEADEMLSMGFQEDVDAIMMALPKENVQKMLFSATLPKWVNALVTKHLQEPTWIDVVGNDDTNATNSKITHQCISCPPHMRGDCIGDLCKVHAGFFGKTLVFTGTKKECDELAANEKLCALGAGVLHGDIGQNQREATMDGFRSGRIKVLVATDVAARGLDVPNVELVVQTHPPTDLDSYVHRAGRTARGGREGSCVTFYSMKEEYIIRLLEHKKGIKMQRVSPPQPSEVVKAAARDAVKQLDHVHQDSVDAFMERAKELITERGAEVILAASLAALTGHARRLRGRSLLSAFEGFTAIMLESERGIENPSKGWYLIRNMLPEECREQCKAVQLCKGGNSVIFDAPDDLVPRILQSTMWRGCKISVARELPELQERDCDIEGAARQLKDRKQQQWNNFREKRDKEKADAGSGRGGRGGGKGGGKGKGKGDKGEGKGSKGGGRGFAGDGGGRGGRGGGRGRS